jgi:DNA-binding LacI/PurR family transcriptional regulator
MLARVAQPDLPAHDIQLRCELVIRESCGAPVDPDDGRLV